VTIVGQIGDDPRGRARRKEGRLVNVERIAFDNLQTIVCRRQKLFEQRNETLVLFDRNQRVSAGFDEGARQASWTGTNLDDGFARDVARAPGDPARQIEIEEKMLAETLLRPETMTLESFANRGQLEQLRDATLVCWI
jgi:hypothetical protein